MLLWCVENQSCYYDKPPENQESPPENPHGQMLQRDLGELRRGPRYVEKTTLRINNKNYS